MSRESPRWFVEADQAAFDDRHFERMVVREQNVVLGRIGALHALSEASRDAEFVLYIAVRCSKVMEDNRAMMEHASLQEQKAFQEFWNQVALDPAQPDYIQDAAQQMLNSRLQDATVLSSLIR